MVLCPHCERDTTDWQDKKVDGRVEASRFINGQGYEYWITTSEFLRCFASLVAEHVRKTKPAVFSSDSYFKCYQDAFKYAYERLLPVKIDERTSFLLCDKILSCKDVGEDMWDAVWEFSSLLLGFFHVDSFNGYEAEVTSDESQG